MWHITKLQLKAELTLMTNLGQVCLSSNLITLHLVNGVGFESVCWEHLFFYWFQDHSLQVDNQHLKRSGILKRGRFKYQRQSLFFFFINQSYVPFCSCYSCFYRYYTKTVMSRIKFVTALLF